MCTCLAFQSRHMPGCEDSLAKVFMGDVSLVGAPAPPGTPLRGTQSRQGIRE